jgi:uncharacterized protein YndB with AHSA1/START domain
MGLTSVVKDPEALTMTVTSEWDVPAERAWQLWADPRQLERWWGPPAYPATVVSHDLVPGGRVNYLMTGPEGDQPKGLWEVLEVEAPRRLVVSDAFADDDWNDSGLAAPMLMTVDIADRGGGGVVMTMTTTFASLDALEQMIAMGMEEGLTEAMGQIDGVLASTPA